MTMQTIYKNFEKEQEKKRKEYLSAGMSEEQIKIMYDFDKAQLARNIAYRRRTQEIETGEENSTYEENKLLDKFRETLSVEMDITSISRFSWIEDIEDEKLARWLKALKDEDLELITKIVIEGYSQAELGRKFGCNQSVFSRKIKRIKKIFETMS